MDRSMGVSSGIGVWGRLRRWDSRVVEQPARWIRLIIGSQSGPYTIGEDRFQIFECLRGTVYSFVTASERACGHDQRADVVQMRVREEKASDVDIVPK